MNWTIADEVKLADLLRRKKEFEEGTLGRIRRFVQRRQNDFYTQDIEGIVKIFTDNAEEIRDMLAPFDSSLNASGD